MNSRVLVRSSAVFDNGEKKSRTRSDGGCKINSTNFQLKCLNYP